MPKINGEAFESLRSACMDTLKAHNLHPWMVQDTRTAWQVFHKAAYEGRIVVNELYKKFNDDHIETALKRIFKH